MPESKCPVTGNTSMPIASEQHTNKSLFPNELNLKILHQNSELCNPMSKYFNYAKEFNKLDLEEVKNDLFKQFCAE